MTPLLIDLMESRDWPMMTTPEPRWQQPDVWEPISRTSGRIQLLNTAECGRGFEGRGSSRTEQKQQEQPDPPAGFSGPRGGLQGAAAGPRWAGPNTAGRGGGARHEGGAWGGGRAWGGLTGAERRSEGPTAPCSCPSDSEPLQNWRQQNCFLKNPTRVERGRQERKKERRGGRRRRGGGSPFWGAATESG